MTVLITGGAGFIGSHVTDVLIGRGYSVRILDNLCEQVHGPGGGTPDYLNPMAELIQGDIRDRSIVESSLDGVEAVVHLAALSARRQIARLSGRPFNIGGGPDNTLSLMELLQIIENLQGKLPDIAYAGWRQGDQRYFVADYRSFARETGWSPQVDVRTGIRELYRWLEQHGPAPDSLLLEAGQTA